MHPPDCPHVWEYEHHPRRADLAGRASAVLIALRRGELDTLTFAVDSRPVHANLFDQLTPAGCDYFAGHYRGEDYRCLRHCPVGVEGDPRVGAAPATVVQRMVNVANSVREGLQALDLLAKAPHERLAAAVAFAGQVFELVLRIHPYVNGNGHASRFVLLSILGRFGYFPRNFPIDPRPGNPDYLALILAHRNGNPAPLEEFVLKAIIG